jgi:hypothetical protein
MGGGGIPTYLHFMELLASSINHEVQQFYIHTPTHTKEKMRNELQREIQLMNKSKMLHNTTNRSHLSPTHTTKEQHTRQFYCDWCTLHHLW